MCLHIANGVDRNAKYVEIPANAQSAEELVLYILWKLVKVVTTTVTNKVF